MSARARKLIVTTEVILALSGFLFYALLVSGGALLGGLVFLSLALLMTQEKA